MLIDDHAIRVHDSVGWNGLVFRRLLERHLGCELAVDRTGEVNTIRFSYYI